MKILLWKILKYLFENLYLKPFHILFKILTYAFNQYLLILLHPRPPWHPKFLSDAQLIDTWRKISWRFQLNPSSRLGGVVRTRFCDGLTDRQTGAFCRVASLTKSLSSENLILFMLLWKLKIIKTIFLNPHP